MDETNAHLPARATRLLNRSRLQQQCQLSNADSSESPKSSNHSVHHQHHRRSVTSRTSTSTSSLHHSGRDTHSSSDDLMLYDKSFRNAMIQDVLQFKRQLLRLRRILQEDEDYLTRTETLNPFETDNGQLFASCGLDSKLLEDIDLASLTSSTTDDPLQELADLRRQVVYLQGQVDDRDRTIRLQRNLIEKLEAEKGKPTLSKCEGDKEVISMATQTERTRPLSIGPDGLSRSKLENTSYTTYFPVMRSSDSTTIMRQQHNPTTTTNQTRRHTIISTTFTNYNHQQQQHQQQQPAAATIAPRRASISWESQTRPTAVVAATTALPTTTYKPVKITLIGEPLQQQKLINTVANSNNNNSSNSNNRLSALTLEQQHKLSNCYNNNNNNNHNSSFSNMTDEQQHVADNVCRKNGLNNGCGQDKPYQNNNKTNGMHSCQQKQQQHQQQQYKKYNYNNTINHSNSSSTNTCKPQPTQPTVTIV